MSIFWQTFGGENLDRVTHMGGSFIRGTVSGEVVDQGRALGLPVYWACARTIAEDIAKLPIDVNERMSGNVRLPRPESNVWILLNQRPNGESSAITVREMVTFWALTWGGGFAEIVRTNGGDPIDLNPIHPSRMQIARNLEGKIVYVVKNDNGDPTVIPQRNMLHVRGVGDTLNGYSVLAMAAESIGLGLAAQKFGAAFFGNGATLGSILQHPAKISDQALDHFRKTWSEMHQGASKAGGFAILEEGMEHTQLSLPPDQAQYLQTRSFQIEEFARWFRITPHKIQHLLRSSFNNIESLNSEYANDTLSAWCVRWEQEVKLKLFNTKTEKNFYIKHNLDALFRGNLDARTTSYQKRWSMASLNANEIRALEEQNPIESGDEYWAPSNMMPVSKAMAAEPRQQQRTNPRQARVAMLGSYARANRQVFLAAVQGVTRKEERAVSTARNKRHGEDFGSWADAFFVDHKKYAIDALTPATCAMAETFCYHWTKEEQCANAHILLALDVCITEWMARSKNCATSRELPDTVDEVTDTILAKLKTAVALEMETQHADN